MSAADAGSLVSAYRAVLDRQEALAKLAPGADRPGIAEYPATPRTVPPPAPPPGPAWPAEPPAWCHIHVPHPPHHRIGHGDCLGILGAPLEEHPTVLALRRHIQRSDVGTGLADALDAEPTELTRAQQIRVHALTAARTLVPGLWVDLDQQADAILEVAARFETWIRGADDD